MYSPILFLIILISTVKSEVRISGGIAIEISHRPHATSLLTNRGASTFSPACGGTIITTNAILSAASCFFTNGIPDQPRSWRARVGSALSTRGGTTHLIRRIAVNPDFSTATRANDIAVLRTTTNIVMRQGLTAPARLGGAALTLNQNQPIIAIGWGATEEEGQPSEQLREVQFWVVSQSLCQNRYAALNFNVDNNMVCSGWSDVGLRGQCEGDNGSPLLNENGAVVAVHSWAAECAGPAHSWYPGINTRTAPYTRWIVAEATA